MYLVLLRPSLISMNSWEDSYNYFLVAMSLAERHHLFISSCCFFVPVAPWDRCSPCLLPAESMRVQLQGGVGHFILPTPVDLLPGGSSSDVEINGLVTT